MRIIVSILLLLFSITIATAQHHITRRYNNVSLSEALRQLNSEAKHYEINFLYNELEDFRISTYVHRKSVPDAIRQMIGYYPIRLAIDGNEITVECIQKSALRYKGAIIDENGLPVAYANVSLIQPSDSSLICGGVSNEAGLFVIPCNIKPVYVRITYVGYKTVYKYCNSTGLGEIRMQPEAQRLKGVIVNGQTPILRRDGEKIIFDTRYVVGAINATDLLRYAPGVMIDDDNISLYGASGIIFCVDNKEQKLGSKEMMQILKSFPASDVEKIEIIQSLGAGYSAEGNSGVINIITKNRGDDFLGGSVSYAHTQYEEHGDEAGANIIYNKGKISSSLNLSGTWDHTLYRENNVIVFPDNQRLGLDNGHICKENYSMRWQMDYHLSDKLDVGAYVMYAAGERRLKIDGIYDFLPKITDSLSSIDTKTNRQENTKTLAANISAVQKLGSQGAKIDYNLDYYRMKMGDTRHSVGENMYIGKSLADILKVDTADYDYKNHLVQTVDNYSAKVDVNYGGFRFGGQYSYTHSFRDMVFPSTETFNYISTTYDEKVLAGYLEYSRKFSNRWSLNVGGRYEHTWTKVENRPIDSDSYNDYGRIFPSFFVGYHPNQSHSLNLSFGSRITRPNIINLNPNWVWKDVNHVSYGNQNLRPSYLYKMMVGYTYKGILNFDLYYNYEPNRIDAVYMVDKQVTYNSWDNITEERSFGINSFYYFAKMKWMNATLMQGISYSKTVRPQKEVALGIVRQYMYPKVESVSYVGVFQVSFFFDRDRKWIANLNTTYNSSEKDVAKSLNARYMVDVGLQYRFCKDRLTVGFSCRNLLASRIKGTEYLGTTAMDFDNKYNYRQFRITLTYNWGARLRQDHHHYESDDIQERVVNDF